MNIVLLSMRENPTVPFPAPQALANRLAALGEKQRAFCVGCACVSQAGELLVAKRIQ